MGVVKFKCFFGSCYEIYNVGLEFFVINGESDVVKIVISGVVEFYCFVIIFDGDEIV